MFKIVRSAVMLCVSARFMMTSDVSEERAADVWLVCALVVQFGTVLRMLS